MERPPRRASSCIEHAFPDSPARRLQGDQAAHQQPDHQQSGRDRSLDEPCGNVHGIGACCALCAAASSSAIQQVEKELGKPLSLQTSFQGNAQAFGASLSDTSILIAAALFGIYLILGVLYESLIHPITIISTLPSAGLGALLLLMAVHYDLSVIAIVGTSAACCCRSC